MALWSVKIRPKPGSASFAVRSCSDVGLAAGWISNFKLIFLLPAVGTGALSPASLSSGPAACFAAGFDRQHAPQDMLLRNAEVQYVCRNAARQSHGSPIRGRCRHRWLFRLPDTSPRPKRLKVSPWLAVL